MKHALAGLLAMLVVGSAGAQGLDELLKQVQQSSAQSARINAEREARFLRNKNEQAALLAQAEGQKAAIEARARTARSAFDAGHGEIAALKQQLQERVGEGAQLFTAARQAAGDFRAVAADSIVTAQFPDRLEFLDALARSPELPSVADLERLWFLLQQEMTENGKVTRFSADVIALDGQPHPAQVTRVGVFAAFTGADFLAVPSGMGQLSALPRQPAGRFRAQAEDFVDHTAGVAPVLIDPSRGLLLQQEAERPTLRERVEMGGVVGYVIIAIGALGALAAAFQLLYLALVGARVRRQLRNPAAPRADNPLGRVLLAFRGEAPQQLDDAEVIELRLSEAVLREVPRLERFQNFLRLVVAAGPLLGLVGTVVGMIITFQVITEQGAGDPRLMAGGISTAMVATVLGLGIAVPLLFVNALLAARSRWITHILDEQATGLLAQRLEQQRGARAGRPAHA